MSVVKSKRTQSKIEFEMTFFKVVDGVDFLVENQFFADYEQMQEHKIFISSRSMSLERLTDSLLYYIKIANSIYPTCMAEWDERRVSIGKAIGTCYAILTNYQRIMIRLRIKNDKYTENINNVTKMINSLKAWRKSDNRLKTKFED